MESVQKKVKNEVSVWCLYLQKHSHTILLHTAISHCSLTLCSGTNDNESHSQGKKRMTSGYSFFPPLIVHLVPVFFYRSDNCSNNDNTKHQRSKFSSQSGLCHCHGLVYRCLLRFCVFCPN